MAPTTSTKKYISMEQKKYLVDYMSENLDFANNRFQTSRGRDHQKQQWIQLTTELNALGGATKTTDQWELSWRDLKQKTKTKWLEIQNRQSGENGLVRKKRDVLSEVEKMILAVVQKDTIDGDGNTQEGGFNEPTLPVALQAEGDVPEQPQDCAYNETFEFLHEEYGNIQASGCEMPSGSSLIEESEGSATPMTSAGRMHGNPAPNSTVIQEPATTRPRATATPSSGRQLGRGQRYSETRMQSMEAQVFKCLDTMQTDKREHMKRKLELQESLLNMEERKLAIKQQKVDALNAINESLQMILNRN